MADYRIFISKLSPMAVDRSQNFTGYWLGIAVPSLMVFSVGLVIHGSLLPSSMTEREKKRKNCKELVHTIVNREGWQVQNL